MFMLVSFRTQFLAFALLLVVSAQPSFGQDLTPEFTKYFERVQKDTLFNGNILIAHTGKIVYQKSIGYADFSTMRKLDANSVFELASVSKQFTAMATMILEQEGKLRFDDTLRKFIPELSYYGITIRHLLNHTSGLPDYLDNMLDKWDEHKIANNEDMIAFLAKSRPKIEFAPGEKYEYSNTGYALLGSIIERVTHKSFGEVLAQKIFLPLGMTHSLVYQRRYSPKKIDDYAYGYVLDRASAEKRYVLPDSSEESSYVYQFDGIVGDGTVNSTLGDLLKWDRALRTTKLVKQRSLDMAFSPGRLNNGDSTDYGFGWQISYDSVLGPRYAHSGGWPGYATYIARYPKSDWTIILLRNATSTAGLTMLLGDVNRILKGKPALLTQSALTVAEATAKRYEGTYDLDHQLALTFSVESGKFYIQASGQQREEVEASNDHTFFSRDFGAEFEFDPIENGKAARMVFTQGGATHICPRVEK